MHQAANSSDAAGEVFSASASTNANDVDTAAVMNSTIAEARSTGGVLIT